MNGWNHELPKGSEIICFLERASISRYNLYKIIVIYMYNEWVKSWTPQREWNHMFLERATISCYDLYKMIVICIMNGWNHEPREWNSEILGSSWIETKKYLCTICDGIYNAWASYKTPPPPPPRPLQLEMDFSSGLRVLLNSSYEGFTFHFNYYYYI